MESSLIKRVNGGELSTFSTRRTPSRPESGCPSRCQTIFGSGLPVAEHLKVIGLVGRFSSGEGASKRSYSEGRVSVQVTNQNNKKRD
jgi:hypothetical protein